MKTFETESEMFEALDVSLRAVAADGNPYYHDFDFHKQRARLGVHSFDEPVEFDYYSEGRLGRLLAPRLAGQLAIVALLPQDDDRELFRDYAVVEKQGRHLGVPLDIILRGSMASRFDFCYAETRGAVADEPENRRRYPPQRSDTASPRRSRLPLTRA